MNLKNCTTEKLFSRLLNNKTKKNEWSYIGELFRRPTEDVFQKCVQLTQSLEINERIIGVNVLSQLGSDKRSFQKETIKLLFEMLKKEENPKIIYLILVAIGHNNERLTKSHIAKIEKFKDSRSSDVRFGLVMALSRCKHKYADDILIFLSHDKHADVRDWATFSIGSLSESNDPKLIAALWERTNDRDDDTRYEAFTGLAKRKQVEIKKNIMKELETGKYGSQLFEAIAELGDTDFLLQLQTLLLDCKNDETVDSGWLADLEYCIVRLKEG
jgi:HEAT repeat protein